MHVIMDESRIIIDWNEQGDGSYDINVVGYRNFKQHFSEAFYSIITGLNVPQTLRASHIVSWATDKTNRMNPENGLCLSATYDAAFDKHLISFDDDYRMIVSKEIKDYYTNDVTKSYFQNYEGKQTTLPSLYLPSKKLLPNIGI